MTFHSNSNRINDTIHTSKSIEISYFIEWIGSEFFFATIIILECVYNNKIYHMVVHTNLKDKQILFMILDNGGIYNRFFLLLINTFYRFICTICIRSDINESAWSLSFVASIPLSSNLTYIQFQIARKKSFLHSLWFCQTNVLRRKKYFFNRLKYIILYSFMLSKVIKAWIF